MVEVIIVDSIMEPDIMGGIIIDFTVLEVDKLPVDVSIVIVPDRSIIIIFGMLQTDLMLPGIGADHLVLVRDIFKI
jgi:hypothetical protein